MHLGLVLGHLLESAVLSLDALAYSWALTGPLESDSWLAATLELFDVPE